MKSPTMSRATPRGSATDSIAFADIPGLKAAVDFRALVSETHEIGRDSKVCCPNGSAHKSGQDIHPSCHIYSDGFHCFVCGAHGDAVDWLELEHGLTTAEAIAELRRRAGGYVPRAVRPVKRPAKPLRSCAARPVPAEAVASYMRRAARLDRLPSALEGRGFTLEDARRLHLVRDRDDLLFTVPGPDGVVLAIKRRYAQHSLRTSHARPRGDQRYTYELPGHGTPAWCSPKMLEHSELLIVEGELNGMACYLARPDLAVMGTAGAGGGLHLEALRGCTVYIYADGDTAGDEARREWARAAHGAGAAKVYVLEPWEADACDLAGTLGRDELRRRLL